MSKVHVSHTILLAKGLWGLVDRTEVLAGDELKLSFSRRC